MANVFKPKRSNTASSVPTTSNLVDGELAVNSADQKIYLRDGASIVEVGNVAAGGISNVVEDTTPQLGGTLDANGNLIDFGDSSSQGVNRLRFGQSADLQIWHNGADSYINQSGTGNLNIVSTTDDADVTIQSDDGSGSTAFYFRADGSTGESILYHYGSEKIKTTSAGVTITGVCTATEFVGNVTGIASTATTVQATENTNNTFYRIPFLSADTGNVSLHSDNGIKYNPSTNELVAATRQVNLIANNSNDETVYLTFADAATAGQELETDTALTYNPSKNQLTVGIVTGATYYGDGSNLTGISAGGISNVVEDTTPQLGGTLETNGNVIDFGDCASFNDSDSGDDRLRFGASQDLQIYHVANSNSYIDNRSQHLYIRNAGTNDNSNIYLQAVDGENSIICLDDSSVNLYFDNTLKLQTVSTGIDVTGTTGTDQLNVSGVSTFSDNVRLLGNSNNVNWVKANDSLEFSDGAKAVFGTGLDFSIVHLTDTTIRNTSGELRVRSDTLKLTGSSSFDDYFVANLNGAVELYYNNSKKFETTGAGVTITGVCTATAFVGDGSGLTGISAGGISNVVEDTTPQLGGTLETNGNLIQFGDSSSSTDDRLRFGAGNDLQIWHNGANSYISQSSNVGDLYLVSLNDDNDVIIQTDSGDGNTTDYFRADGSTGEAKLFHYGSEKIKTISTGVSVTGNITATGNVSIAGTAPQGILHVYTNTLNADNGYNGQNFGIVVETEDGYNDGDEGNGICFTQQYSNDATDSTKVRTGAIIGYKDEASGDFGGGLKFKVQQFGANPLLTAMTLDKAGQVGIGTEIPTSALTVTGDIQTDGAFRAESSNSTERFEIAYNETTDSLDFSYFAS